MLYGLGPNTSATLTTAVYEGGLVLHSIYIQALVEQGLIGFMLLGFFIASLMQSIRKMVLKNNLYFAVFLVTGASLSGLYYWDQFVFYLISYQVAREGNQESPVISVRPR